MREGQLSDASRKRSPSWSAKHHFPSASLFSPLHQRLPRASNGDIGRRSSRLPAALATLSLEEEKGANHETLAQPREDWKSLAAGLTSRVLQWVGWLQYLNFPVSQTNVLSGTQATLVPSLCRSPNRSTGSANFLTS